MVRSDEVAGGGPVMELVMALVMAWAGREGGMWPMGAYKYIIKRINLRITFVDNVSPMVIERVLAPNAVR